MIAAVNGNGKPRISDPVEEFCVQLGHAVWREACAYNAILKAVRAFCVVFPFPDESALVGKAYLLLTTRLKVAEGNLLKAVSGHMREGGR